MLDFSDVRIFLCTRPTNMNYSFDRLMGRAQEILEQDPCSGHLFLFLNRSRDRIKVLGSAGIPVPAAQVGEASSLPVPRTAPPCSPFC